MRNLTEWFEVRSDPASEQRRQTVLGSIELAPTLLVPLAFTGAQVSIGRARDWHDAINPDLATFWGLLLLAVCAAAPPVFRPLTTPGVALQKRYAVCALILGAFVAWLMFLAETLDRNNKYEDPSKLGILLILALVGFAGFLRIGWGKATP